MAVNLDSLKRRELLNKPVADPDRFSEIGRDLIVAEYLSDAVDFLEKAGDEDGLSRLIPVAVDEGDLFILTRVKKALGRPLEDAELKALAENAERLGKASFAEQARGRLADLRGEEAPPAAGDKKYE